MAKWGEGDPRWIVEERADAKNVNNWHWSEKNATQWSINKINGLLTGLTIENDDYSCVITTVSKCEGEAVANNRKSKLIFFYEWIIAADWTGQKKNSDNKTNFTGKLEVNNLSEEFTADELDVIITTSSTTSTASEIKRFMMTTGSKKVRDTLAIYINDLKQEYGKDLILPTNEKNQIPPMSPSNCTVPASNINKPNNPSQLPPPLSNNVEKDVKSTVELAFTEDFMCRPEDLYDVLTIEHLTASFTRSLAKVQPVRGGLYELFGGNVSGCFIELKPKANLSMCWRKKNWPENHHSLVKMDFLPCETGARLTLKQSNVPQFDEESTKSGWNTHYFLPIRQTFGYGKNVGL